MSATMSAAALPSATTGLSHNESELGSRVGSRGTQGDFRMTKRPDYHKIKASKIRLIGTKQF